MDKSRSLPKNKGVVQRFCRLKVYRNLSDYKARAKAIVTVGTFDGVHVGHQKLLSTINRIAEQEEGESVLLTFSPHPRLVLFPDDNDLKLLTTLNERIDRLRKSGLNHLIIHPFSIRFSRITALDYVSDILVKQLGVHKLVIGYDHHFGRNREGNLEYLKNIAPQYDFEVIEIPAQEIQDVNVSSTKIRNALLEGNIERATKYLGYEYGIDGSVVAGQKIGRTMGFPTANIKPDDVYKLIPGNGVYAVMLRIDEEWHKGMANIGTRPTVTESADIVIEVHVFNFDRDIYGKKIRVIFVKRLRDELKFENLASLAQQMENDADDTKSALADRSLDFMD